MTTAARTELALRVTAALHRARPGAELLELYSLTSGASGITLRGRVRAAHSDYPVAVRTIPDGLAATGHRDLGRQVRILDHLRAVSTIPVPEIIAFDAGEPSTRAPLYVMAFVDGANFDPTNPVGGDRCAPEIVTARAHAAVRTLSDLQDVDVVGLAEPVQSLADEVTRWERALATTSGPHRELAAGLLARLRASTPAPRPATLVHGDYRLGNLLFREAVLTAVLDWEIWSVADPRLDLGWFLARGAAGHPSRPRDALGFPAAADLLASYTRDGTGPLALDWFLALAAVKHAAASALIDKRSPAASGRDPDRVIRLLRWADGQLTCHERTSTAHAGEWEESCHD